MTDTDVRDRSTTPASDRSWPAVLLAALIGVGLALTVVGLITLRSDYLGSQAVGNPLVSYTPAPVGDEFTAVVLPSTATPPEDWNCLTDEADKSMACLVPNDQAAGTSLQVTTPAARPETQVAPTPSGTGLVDGTSVLMTAVGALLTGIAALLAVVHTRWRKQSADDD